jgi:hypothetical protein
MKHLQAPLQYNGYVKATRIAILYLIDNDDSVKATTLLEQEFAADGKKVHKIGFTTSKTLPANFTPKGGSECLCTSDLAWNLVPLPSRTGSFLDESYDIFINVSPSDLIAMQYLSIKFKAGLKAGPAALGNEKIYDLQVAYESGQPIEDFTKHIIHYLKLINQ